jgi:hypothetical protein
MQQPAVEGGRRSLQPRRSVQGQLRQQLRRRSSAHFVRLLSALDPFTLRASQIQSAGTPLGGCIRLVILILLLTYIVVVAVEYEVRLGCASGTC